MLISSDAAFVPLGEGDETPASRVANQTLAWGVRVQWRTIRGYRAEVRIVVVLMG